METNELRAALEAILFVSSDPVKIDDLAEAFPDAGRESIAQQLEDIKRGYDENVFGFMLEQTAGGWRLASRPEHDPVLRKYFAKKGENRLSIAALETLAIVAYRQPITAPEISEIRGVNSTGVVRTLLERRMIRVSGRKNVVGSPFLYRTTKEFLVHFGLNDIRDLPRLEEFGDLIGETINDDLVAAINAAETTPASEETPLAPEEEDALTVDGNVERDADADGDVDGDVEREVDGDVDGDATARESGTSFEAAMVSEVGETAVAPEETQLESDEGGEPSKD